MKKGKWAHLAKDGRCKLSPSDRDEIYKLAAQGVPKKIIAEHYGVTYKWLLKILSRKALSPTQITELLGSSKKRAA